MKRTPLRRKKYWRWTPKPKRVKSISKEITSPQCSDETLDTLCSLFVRLRAIFQAGGCEKCLRQTMKHEDLDWAHGVGRDNHAIRWDPRNGAGLCRTCHTYLDLHPKEKEEWFKQHIGEEEYEKLRELSNSIQKVDRDEKRGQLKGLLLKLHQGY